MFEIDKANVGQIIQEVRQQRGLKQKDLADKIKVNKSAMSKIETGEQTADIQTLVNISETLNVRLEYLLGIDRDNIDDDTHLVNLFIKRFFRITTTQRFRRHKKVFREEDLENLFYSVRGQYVILEGPKRIFSLIKGVAKANVKSEEERKTLIKKALKTYRDEKDEKDVDKYFLLSKNEIQDLLEEYAKTEKVAKRLRCKKMKLLGGSSWR